MDISKVILQLRQLAPIFNGNVAGAASYTNGVFDQVWLGRPVGGPMMLPAAYVVPGDDTATGNLDEVALKQIVTERIQIYVDFDNESDRRGQTVTQLLMPVKKAIYAAILNWRPDYNYLVPNDPNNRESQGLYFIRGELTLMDRARLHYLYEFGLDVTITDADGWIAPSVPFTDIALTVALVND